MLIYNRLMETFRSDAPASPVIEQTSRLSTLAAQVYASLAEQIVAGKLAPGQKLDEATLAEQFGVSRTPVREALRELWVRKLVDFKPRRGGIVAQFETKELADMLEAECELDGLCARLASRHMSAIEKRALRDVHERIAAIADGGALGEFFTLNGEFHDLISQGSGNATLTSMARDLRFRLSPFRRPKLENDRQRLARAHHEHDAVVTAILDGNQEQAYEAMRAHNARVNAGVLRLMQGQMAPLARDERDG